MIEVRSIFDQSVSFALLKFQMRKLRVLLLLFPIVICGLGVLLLVAAILSESDTFMGILLIVLGLMYYPLVFFLGKSMQKKQNKTLKIMGEETINIYRFDQNSYFNETVKGNEFRSMTEQAYHTLHKAFETQSYYFLYISSMQAHVIPKKDIVTGSAAELTALLSTRLGVNYKFINMK